MLLLAGDLTRHGTAEEARVVAHEVAGLPVPVAAVLGNHDYQSDQEAAVAEELARVGVHVLEGDGVVLDIAGDESRRRRRPRASAAASQAAVPAISANPR